MDLAVSMGKNIKAYLFLHLLLMVFSTSGVLSKLASGKVFLSWPFLLLYGGVIALLGIYALGWQQVSSGRARGVSHGAHGCPGPWG